MTTRRSADARAQERGFTFLEVMLGLVVLALLLFASASAGSPRGLLTWLLLHPILTAVYVYILAEETTKLCGSISGGTGTRGQMTVMTQG